MAAPPDALLCTLSVRGERGRLTTLAVRADKPLQAQLAGTQLDGFVLVRDGLVLARDATAAALGLDADASAVLDSRAATIELSIFSTEPSCELTVEGSVFLSLRKFARSFLRSFDCEHTHALVALVRDGRALDLSASPGQLGIETKTRLDIVLERKRPGGADQDVAGAVSVVGALGAAAPSSDAGPVTLSIEVAPLSAPAEPVVFELSAAAPVSLLIKHYLRSAYWLTANEWRCTLIAADAELSPNASLAESGLVSGARVLARLARVEDVVPRRMPASASQNQSRGPTFAQLSQSDAHTHARPIDDNGAVALALVAPPQPSAPGAPRAFERAPPSVLFVVRAAAGDRADWPFRMGRSSEFAFLYESYAATFGIERNALEMFFSGQVLGRTETPEDVKLFAHDVVIAQPVGTARRAAAAAAAKAAAPAIRLAAEQTTTVKRPRGRPRKHPLPASTLAPSPTVTPAARGGHSRANARKRPAGAVATREAKQASAHEQRLRSAAREMRRVELRANPLPTVIVRISVSGAPAPPFRARVLASSSLRRAFSAFRRRDPHAAAAGHRVWHFVDESSGRVVHWREQAGLAARDGPVLRLDARVGLAVESNAAATSDGPSASRKRARSDTGDDEPRAQRKARLS